MLNKGNVSGLSNDGTIMNINYIQGNKKGG